MKDWQSIIPPAGEPGARDWGALAFEAAKERLQQCMQAMYCQEGECEEHPHAANGGPSCPMPENSGLGCMGCDDCTVREVLTAAWPIIEAAIRSGDFDD